MKLSIVVPAFNEERLLAATLQSIQVAARVFEPSGGWELIVCDNNSSDRTAEIARASGAQVVIEPHNQISRARNRGASVAAGEWLLFVDADSSPSCEIFADLKEAIESGQVIGGGSTLDAGDTALSVRMAIAFWNVISRRLSWAAGAFVYCEAKAYRQVGGFSEELYASEELDLSSRLKRLAREQGREFRILNQHPLRTSDRKFHLYGSGEILAALGRFLRHPRRMLRSRSECSPWYDGRR